MNNGNKMDLATVCSFFRIDWNAPLSFASIDHIFYSQCDLLEDTGLQSKHHSKICQQYGFSGRQAIDPVYHSLLYYFARLPPVKLRALICQPRFIYSLCRLDADVSQGWHQRNGRHQHAAQRGEFRSLHGLLIRFMFMGDLNDIHGHLSFSTDSRVRRDDRAWLAHGPGQHRAGAREEEEELHVLGPRFFSQKDFISVNKIKQYHSCFPGGLRLSCGNNDRCYIKVGNNDWLWLL